MDIINQETINAEAFSSALNKLRQGGQNSTDEEHQIRKDYGDRVADDMAHGSPSEIGHSLVELLGTLPGSNFSLEVKNRQHNARTLVSSYKAVDAELDRQGDGLLEATINELDTDQISVNIRRSSSGDSRCALNLDIGEKGDIRKGNVWFKIGKVDQKVEFGPDGTVGLVRDGKIKSLEELEERKINIPKLINLITNSSTLDKGDSTKDILQSVVEQSSMTDKDKHEEELMEKQMEEEDSHKSIPDRKEQIRAMYDNPYDRRAYKNAKDADQFSGTWENWMFGKDSDNK